MAKIYTNLKTVKSLAKLYNPNLSEFLIENCSCSNCYKYHKHIAWKFVGNELYAKTGPTNCNEKQDWHKI
jgi:hypothetical protein